MEGLFAGAEAEALRRFELAQELEREKTILSEEELEQASLLIFTEMEVVFEGVLNELSEKGWQFKVEQIKGQFKSFLRLTIFEEEDTSEEGSFQIEYQISQREGKQKPGIVIPDVDFRVREVSFGITIHPSIGRDSYHVDSYQQTKAVTKKIISEYWTDKFYLALLQEARLQEAVSQDKD